MTRRDFNWFIAGAWAMAAFQTVYLTWKVAWHEVRKSVQGVQESSTSESEGGSLPSWRERTYVSPNARDGD
jgi:hypothetical protein